VSLVGGNSGIGLETCKALAYAGAKVILCSRSVEAGQKAIEEEIKVPGVTGYAVPEPDIVVKQLDLASLQNVARFCEDINNTVDHIDLLVLNAGVMMIPTRQETVDGLEMQIGVNHFGHFHLTNLLLPKIKAQETRTRIVVLSSKAHSWGTVDLNDLHFTKGRKYDQSTAYGQAKLANILFAKQLADTLPPEKIIALSLHPGVIATNLARHVVSKGSVTHVLFTTFITDKNIAQGAATTVYACVAPELEEHNGSYLADCNVADNLLNKEGVDADKKKRAELWRVTQEQIDLALAKTAVEK
jgi:NAD(P)-dependent dehydrogenase (short-subunit alcohol dehydrogenase family)